MARPVCTLPEDLLIVDGSVGHLPWSPGVCHHACLQYVYTACLVKPFWIVLASPRREENTSALTAFPVAILATW